MSTAYTIRHPEDNCFVVKYPDRSEMFIAVSGNGNPPNRQSGQHTNVSTQWVKLPDHTEWTRADGARSFHKTSERAAEFNNAHDAFAALTGQVAPHAE